MPPVVHALIRSGLVLTGLVLFAVGVGNVIAGRSKAAQYAEVLQLTPPPVQPDPAALFPAASEGNERHALALAKLAFYQLLVTAGQFLAALGGAFIAIGLIRVWMRSPRVPLEPRAN